MQQQQPPPANDHQAEVEAVAMLCLQAQQVAALPDATEGRRIQLSTTCTPAPAPAAAVCRAGVADFHRQVLLLHCAPVNSIDAVAVTVTMAATCNDQQHPAAARIIASVNVDLAEQLRRPCPSPSVLSFVLGVGGTTATTTAAVAGAVLSLTLHHRRLVTTTGTGCSLLRSCLRLPLPLAGCCPPVLRTTMKHNRQHQGPAEVADDGGDGDGDGDSSSSGFITIEKGTISRRRPPSDYLLTTDDDEVDGKRPPGAPTTTTTCCWSLSSLDDDTKVENDFLAMLMLEDDDDDDDLVDQLDALIKDAEADLPVIWPSRG
ncbi:unnamed protein product [Miscanthus lutarioriparius]|uniref:Uncharacterized protein n=1 Tax=Miscanthus lutarioriparius TaxID=422564 RepID=A0A811SNT0_9POAL|nr:unnamed protein product [Miscanthus lutarioriparius]